MRIQKKNGGTLIGDAAAAPLRSAAGAITQGIFLIRGMGCPPQLTENLLRMQAAESISLLLRGFIHNCNNILGAIMGYGELLKADIDSLPQDAADYLQKMLDCSEQCRIMLQAITWLKNGAHDAINIKTLRLLVEETLRMIEPLLPGRVRMHATVSGDFDAPVADEQALRKLVVNLCLYVWQAMGSKGGNLLIHGDALDLSGTKGPEWAEGKPGPYLRLTASSPNAASAVNAPADISNPYSPSFQPTFFAIEQTAREMGGAVALRSDPEQGTVLEILLPKPPASQGFMLDPAMRQTLRGTGRILLAGDDTATLDLVNRTLLPLGYHIGPRRTLEEVRENLCIKPVRCDLLIVALANLSRHSVESVLKIRSAMPDTRIIMSAQANEAGQEEEAALQGGIDGFVRQMKDPYEIARLVKRVLNATR